MVQKRQYASLSSLFAQLFIELADWHRPLYLVIDDYHLINNPVIHDRCASSCAISRKI
jgi:LuxR family maltose regulon positive regulatory protein